MKWALTVIVLFKKKNVLIVRERGSERERES